MEKCGLVLRTILFCALISSTNGDCQPFVDLGYQIVDLGRDLASCNARSGAWVTGCCFGCETNKFMNGAIVMQEKNVSKDIKSAVQSSTPNVTTIFQMLPGIYVGDGNCGLSISNYVSAQFTGVCGAVYTTIDCNNSAYHLKWTGNSLTLKNITLKNGFSAENGGCISVLKPGATITLIDTILLNCVSYKDGGALSINNVDESKPSQSVSISMNGSSRIQNCSARGHGGALYLEAGSM
jgi:hypothetical protein